MATGTINAISLFSGLPPDAVHDIERRCSWQRFDEGEQIFDRESDALDVYFVVSGGVRISRVLDQEREVALADVEAGQYFGEIAAIDGLRRSARVVALQQTVVASLDGTAFVAFMGLYPSIALQVMGRLTRIVRDLDDRITKISTQSESQRIWSHLLRLAEPQPSSAGQWIIRDLPNHKEIAAWAGTSRESVAQAIGELARIGIVRRRTIGLVINDLNRLQLMASAR